MNSPEEKALHDSPTAQPLLDLHRLLVGIRRWRRFWLLLGVAGLVVGAALAILVPSPPTASTRLLVVHEDDQPSDNGTLIKTDIAVLETTRVAGAALQTLHSTERPEDFVKDYSAVAVSNNVLDLTVTGSSEADASARAKALADAFIADYVRRIQAVTAAGQQALFKERDQAQADLTQVDAQISAASGKNSQTSATQLESLYSQRADLASRVSDLTGQAEDAGVGAPKATAGTQVIDQAGPVPRQFVKTAATDAGLGLVFGLVAGIALAAVIGVARDRPVLRREISAHLNASVVAQLTSRSGKERAQVAATLARLIRDDPRSVSLTELGCPKVADGLAADMAAGLGTTVGVGSVAPGAAWTDLAELGLETVLVVRAGYAETRWLHTVARQLADCRIAILGVVLVDPDPKDRTDGTLWDGLHTALRGRERRHTDHDGDAATAFLAPAAGQIGRGGFVTGRRGR